jgi:hypothetical protein
MAGLACRLLGLANVLDGMSREQAARQAGMDRQTLRDWVIRRYGMGKRGRWTHCQQAGANASERGLAVRALGGCR